MGIKVNGLDKLHKQLKQMQKSVKELEGKQNVSLDELLTDNFMQKNTVFRTLDDMFDKSPFKVKTQEDFENIPEEKLDEYISSKTKFSNWKSMLENATSEYVSRKLGF